MWAFKFRAGATAMGRAVDAMVRGERLEIYGKGHRGLWDALDFWGKVRF